MPKISHAKLLSISQVFHISILFLGLCTCSFFCVEHHFSHFLCIQLTPVEFQQSVQTPLSLGNFPALYCFSIISHCNYPFTCNIFSVEFHWESLLYLSFPAAYPAKCIVLFTKCGLIMNLLIKWLSISYCFGKVVYPSSGTPIKGCNKK